MSSQKSTPGASFEGVHAQIVDPIADARWFDLVTSTTGTSIFHHPAWLRLLRDSYHYPMEAWCLERGGQLIAGLPVATVRSRLTGSRLVAVPFSDQCEPIYRLPRAELEEPLYVALESERARRQLGLEIHGAAPGPNVGHPADSFLRHVLPLEEGFESVVARVHRSKRRDARRASRLGVTVVLRRDRHAVDAFFRLQVATRRRHGVPTQPKRFFRGIAHLISTGLGFVLLGEWEGRTVSASVYLLFGGVLTRKYAASDPNLHHLRANSLTDLEGIRHACEHGCHLLDWGRTELDNPGLRAYKLDFGFEELPLQYMWLGARGESASVRSMSTLQKRTIQRSPSWVGRLAGAALYRHFA